MTRGGGDPDTPLRAAEFAAAFAGLVSAKCILAAVSGGPDSTALMGGFASWGRVPVRVATVDHRLRTGSQTEAENVAAAAVALGLRHAVLTWTGENNGNVSQEAARNARYGLLEAHARAIGASHLVTAHTLDDQAETLMLRLAAGSGLSGLAGMRRETARDELIHARPFLFLPKSRLVATCRERGWPFVEDPSNADPRFGRVRWRGLMPRLAAEGLGSARLARLAARLARADEALDRTASETFSRVAGREDATFELDMAALAREPEEVALRVLKLALDGDRAGPPPRRAIRLQRLEDCLAALLEAVRSGHPTRRTLAGRVLHVRSDGVLRIALEAPRARGRTER